LYTDIVQLIRLALLLSLSQVVSASGGFISVLIIAPLGKEVLAATGLIFGALIPLLFASQAMLFAIGILIRDAYSKGDEKTIICVMQQGFYLATALGVIVVILFYNITYILVFFKQDVKVVFLVQKYMNFAIWGVFPYLWLTVFNQSAIGLSLPSLPVTGSIIAFSLSVVLSYVLILGKVGFPSLGIAGLGLATILTSWTVLFSTAWLLSYKKSFDNCRLVHFGKLDMYVFLRLLRLGWPISIQYALELGAFASITLLMGTINVSALAAQQIASQITFIATMLPLGFSYATAIHVSHARALNNGTLAKNITLISTFAASVIMAFLAIFYLVFPELIVSLYAKSGEDTDSLVFKYAITLLGIAGFMQLFDSMRNIMTGALRGLQDTRIPMFIGGLSCWLIGVPLGWLLCFKFNIGPAGLYYGFLVGILWATLVIGQRFFRHRFIKDGY
jgi:multidrug resistance protein, MATE family